MSLQLQPVDGGEFLLHVPSSLRASLEMLDRAGSDWNMVGNLLAATPTSGVASTGTGQWTSALWQAVKWEFRNFLCAESEPYAGVRKEWSDLKEKAPAQAMATLAAHIGARVGVASGLVVPLVTWLFVVARRMGTDALCVTLSAPPFTPGQTPAPLVRAPQR